MNLAIEQIGNGLELGSVYALVAVGFTMVYGILFFVNLPHGDILMAGTYCVLVLVGAGVPYLPAILFGTAFTAALAMTVELIAYRRLRNARRLAPMLSAIGVSYAISNGVLVTLGPQPQPFPQPISGHFQVFGIELSAVIVATVTITIVAVVTLEFFIRWTRIGVAMRAASQDRTATALMGVNVDFVISIIFAISGALALLGGVMLGWRYGTVSPLIGFSIMLKAFVACVLGGIGSIVGAMLGGYILGLSESLVTAYLSSAYRDAITFLILIAVLLIKPSGILKGRTDVMG